MTLCPGCGLCLPDRHCNPPDRFNASGECWQLYSDLSCYMVAKQDAAFIHQHAVDAYAAQHSGGTTRNITVAFGLIGLYLALEKGYTGKQVQQAHMQIAQIRKDWLRLEPPFRPSGISVRDVLWDGCGEGRDDPVVDGSGLGELGGAAGMGAEDDRGIAGPASGMKGVHGICKKIMSTHFFRLSVTP